MSRKSKVGATFTCSFITIIYWPPFFSFLIHANENKAMRHCLDFSRHIDYINWI